MYLKYRRPFENKIKNIKYFFLAFQAMKQQFVE